jgi:hypothetical protein
MGGWGGLILQHSSRDWFFLGFRGAGGGKCPEEEHTTCSGGPTINCHKRGLWGERNYKINYFVITRKKQYFIREK